MTIQRSKLICGYEQAWRYSGRILHAARDQNASWYVDGPTIRCDLSERQGGMDFRGFQGCRFA